MVNGNRKNFSASLGSREAQAGTAVRYNSTAVRDVLANVKKKNGVLVSFQRRDLCLPPSLFLSPSLHLSVMRMLCVWILTSTILFQNLENTMITSSSRPISWYLSKRNESNMSRGYLHAHVHWGIFNIYDYISKGLEIAYMPSSRSC